MPGTVGSCFQKHMSFCQFEQLVHPATWRAPPPSFLTSPPLPLFAQGRVTINRMNMLDYFPREFFIDVSCTIKLDWFKPFIESRFKTIITYPHLILFLFFDLAGGGPAVR